MFDASANCFLNALVREFTSWNYGALPSNLKAVTQCEHSYYCQTPDNQQLFLPLIRHSAFGRSYFHPVSYLQSSSESIGTALTFEQLLEFLQQTPELFHDKKLGMPQTEHLYKVIQRSLESHHNISKVIAYRSNDLETLYQAPLNFIESEQSLLIGHSIHPCPKSRSGFNAEDEKRYVPEYGQSFQLCWFAADKDILYSFSGTEKALDEYCLDLIKRDGSLLALSQQLKSHQLLIPCHPWQAQHWRQSPQLQPYFDNNQLVELGQHGKYWRATSSLRSLYQADSPWMLKFSLTTQLTNSVRHLQPEEMIRGQVIEKVLTSDKAREMSQQLSSFEIMHEPISLALKDEQGNALANTAIIWRDNPFYGDEITTSNTEVLSSLLQDYPDKATNRLSLRLQQIAKTEQSDVHHLADTFLQRFLEVVIKPIIKAQAEYGLLFGAHQQNIVVQLDQQMMPIKAYFRDCQGTGFSALAKTLYGEQLLSDTSDSGNLFDNDMVIHLFTYYLLVNSCFNAISSLTLTGLLSENKAKNIYQQFLQSLKNENLPDTRVVDYLLQAEKLWAKGNFYCNLHAINENTMEDPFLIYHQMDNPLFSASTEQSKTNAA